MRKRLPQWMRTLFILLLTMLLASPALSESSPPTKPPEAAPPAGTQGANKPTPKAAKPAPAAETKAPAKASESQQKPPASASPAAPDPAPPVAPTGAPKTAPGGTRPPVASPGGSGPEGKSKQETHTLKLRDLEARVDELKEQIRRSHARLSLLSETLLSGGLGGARADIVFRNELGNAFRVRRILVVLDGAVQYKKQDDTDELSSQKEIPIFSGPIPPGDHTLQVVVGLQGHGYGIFSYLKAFKPEVKHTRSFTVEEGRAIRIEITAWEKGSSTTPLEERPSLRLTEKVTDRREAELAEEE